MNEQEINIYLSTGVPFCIVDEATSISPKDLSRSRNDQEIPAAFLQIAINYGMNLAVKSLYEKKNCTSYGATFHFARRRQSRIRRRGQKERASFRSFEGTNVAV
jgi:hypothetical protein